MFHPVARQHSIFALIQPKIQDSSWQSANFSGQQVFSVLVMRFSFFDRSSCGSFVASHLALPDCSGVGELPLDQAVLLRVWSSVVDNSKFYGHSGNEYVQCQGIPGPRVFILGITGSEF